MNFSDSNVDDLLRKVLRKLLSIQSTVSPTKGPNRELIACNLTLKNPLNRLSRSDSKNTLASCLGEFIWYISKSDRLSDIQYYIPQYKKYSDDGVHIYGAYGPRIFYRYGFNQLDFIIKKLSTKPDTRKALIQIFDPADSINAHKDVPCTCSLQFFLRNNKVHLVTHMRSNDAYMGLPHDIFCFTMFQEIVAKSLGKKVGHYHHLVGSLHLYENDVEKARTYLAEGFQTVRPMPDMPIGDQNNSLEFVVKAAEAIRLDCEISQYEKTLPPYWSDIVRILQIIHLLKGPIANRQSLRQIAEIKQALFSDYFGSYVNRRTRRVSQQNTRPEGDLLGINEPK